MKLSMPQCSLYLEHENWITYPCFYDERFQSYQSCYSMLSA